MNRDEQTKKDNHGVEGGAFHDSYDGGVVDFSEERQEKAKSGNSWRDKRPSRVFLRLWVNLRNFMHGRFDLRSDSASQKSVVDEVRKGIDFRGTNLWVLMFAVFIASLGLNVNSTAVIIGAMLISPLMGPITGIGLALGINDFEMLKQAWRNFLLMVVMSLVTSTFFFIISPISVAQSELLARTTPTTYDVLIAFFGGMAGMVAQTRKDRAVTVVSGVAIATALMPPLCTAGFGIATGSAHFFFGALYLFTINTVFIAVATYLVVLFLRYEKVTILDPVRQKKNNRYVAFVIALVGIPSILFGVNIVRRTAFEENVDRYVAKVFQYNKTMLVDCQKEYRYEDNKSKVIVSLVGEPLSEDVIDNARAQLVDYGLSKTELVVRQADNDTNLDIGKLQKSYAEIIDEKNAQIRELRERIASFAPVDTLAGEDISREIALVTENIASVSVSKHTTFANGVKGDTEVVAIVKAEDPEQPIDLEKVRLWLSVRTKNGSVKVVQE